jgi:mRNA-degrading endonuclease RelE of RelBE toxin-antitoxin system
MSFSVFTIPPFDKQLKRLARKYPSIKEEYKELIRMLSDSPVQGKALGNNCYKIRMAIRSKGKGKSGGARIIIHIHIEKQRVYLLSIYDKSSQETLSDKELKELLAYII